jgi:transcriptional regulator with XRE-family HTH domain
VSYISRIERGQDPANVAMLRKLAAVLGLSYNELVVLAGYADPPNDVRDVDDPAADGHWYAGLPSETRRLIRALVEGAHRSR